MIEIQRQKPTKVQVGGTEEKDDDGHMTSISRSSSGLVMDRFKSWKDSPSLHGSDRIGNRRRFLAISTTCMMF
jgi:hypothetical protein